MKDSIFPGEKWCFFMCAIAEGKTIENLVAPTSNPEAFDAILRWSPAGARILLLFCLMRLRGIQEIC